MVTPYIMSLSYALSLFHQIVLLKADDVLHLPDGVLGRVNSDSDHSLKGQLGLLGHLSITRSMILHTGDIN